MEEKMNRPPKKPDTKVTGLRQISAKPCGCKTFYANKRGLKFLKKVKCELHKND